MELFMRLAEFYLVAADDPRIGATHICLYLAILNQWHTAGCTSPVTINRRAIMRNAKIRSRHTYNKCMNDLHDFGYLLYTRSVNGYSSSSVILKNA